MFYTFRNRCRPHLYIISALFHLHLSTAQEPSVPTPTPASSPSTPAPPAEPSDIFNPNSPPSIIGVAPSSLPSIIDGAGYAGSADADGDGDRNDGVLNYYFLLLAILIVAIALAYWMLSRRQKQKRARILNSRQSALELDARTWSENHGTGRGFGVGRWRFNGNGHDPRPEEGLNDRGEAPPPYLSKPEPSHQVRSQEGGEMDLGNMSSHELAGKPPEYEAVSGESSRQPSHSDNRT